MVYNFSWEEENDPVIRNLTLFLGIFRGRIKMFNFFTQTTPKEIKQGKMIALMNQKGGVGKTTMAYNLAHAFKEKGDKVLCVDMDPQGNFSSLFGLELNDERVGIHQLMVNSVKELKALHNGSQLSDALVQTKDGIDLLPSGQELSGFELTVAGINAPRQLILKKMLEKWELRSKYDVIIIDGPPTLGLLVVNILCAADGVLYPFVPDRFSEQGLLNIKQVVEDISEMEITNVPKNLGYIPNLFDQRRKQAHADLEQIQLKLGAEGVMFEPFFNKVQFGKSLAQRKSVFHYKTSEFKGLQDQFLKMTDVVHQELQK